MNWVLTISRILNLCDEPSLPNFSTTSYAPVDELIRSQVGSACPVTTTNDRVGPHVFVLGKQDRDAFGALLSSTLANDLESPIRTVPRDGAIFEALVQVAEPAFVRALTTFACHSGNLPVVLKNY